ncbi:CoA-acylating methylmalonate-semialdehyde dehydrogenase [Propionicimonas sp.]|uniref:CoA-acylating methylmalonate-semialdehyde dehydrogenase n=1 Tax=Propionicimonas sp. TaxID=1955623 RepID=UPI0017FD4A1C|nr:CoA-acylating methylmalonate-semialdehyde dehydrogenase [Propionicimonas sp.]MBU3976639.1 CoA-acylating methylmalonate-semialdehyde dehydrogenase [Actinomycetota bacterium]MBA3020361.1 CoA-acylating methylmalonate-semialdehyde dehydrogenase [Propionicimonas sp.]MBU3986534.1 CoA-acylating methylmalonate-semialdehyde dehydrogenase [Actinomycetota bacterium]MBU4007314.1 CoA-acylating methylmalonate-semialdehyde dehydrogenase [Actinomycetota bacterium]MBU4065067.1 CoA-acylating methylmalonate-s
MTFVPHVIGGQEVTGDLRSGPIFNPATGEQIASVGFADTARVAEAVAAATAALPGWRATGLIKRADVFFRLRQLLVERSEELASIVTTEHGKVFADALGEISRGLENVEFAAGLVHLLKGEYSEQVSRGVDVHSVKQPVGVVAAITPFNFPIMVPLWMTASAIACGNTVVLKPSEKDPSASVFLAKLFAEAGLPAGVLNVVHGDAEAVNALLDAPEVKAVSFVGSTPIAKAIYTRATANGKRVQALGGAKNHMIVMPDADLDSAADAAVSAAYGAAGERCMAISVLVPVGEAVAEALLPKIAERVAKLKIGVGSDPASEMGPLITAQHRAKVAGYVTGAADEGAEVVIDGALQKFNEGGFFIGISLLDKVQPGMRVYDEEIFGPVLSVVRVASYDEAVNLVNSNRYANGTAIFTRDGRTAKQFEFDIEVGMIGVNVPIPVPVGAFSFGGWRDSLFGDSHIYGPESVHFYTRSKVVTSRWPEPSESQVDLGFPSNH